MAWMVTGGAGYIGAHVVRAMLAGGLSVVVYDDLSTGNAEKVPAGVPLVIGSVLDRQRLGAAMRDHDVSGVVHVAAKKQVGESVERPLHYYRENVTGLETLLESMVAGASTGWCSPRRPPSTACRMWIWSQRTLRVCR